MFRTQQRAALFPDGKKPAAYPDRRHGHLSSTPTVALTLQRLNVVSSSCVDEIVSLSVMDSPTQLAVGEGPLDLLRGAVFMNPVMIVILLVAAAVLEKSAPQLGVSIAHGFMVAIFLLPSPWMPRGPTLLSASRPF